MESLVSVPVVLPLLGAGLTLVLGGRLRRLQRAHQRRDAGRHPRGVVRCCWSQADRTGRWSSTLGGWPAPVGIVLVADRLAALMLVVSSAVTLCVLLYSIGQGIARRPASTTPVAIFHPTYLVLTAGVANAFLAGDLFNLFVGVRDPAGGPLRADHPRRHRDRIRAGTTYVGGRAALLDDVPDRARPGLRGHRHASTSPSSPQRLDDLPDGVRWLLS